MPSCHEEGIFFARAGPFRVRAAGYPHRAFTRRRAGGSMRPESPTRRIQISGKPDESSAEKKKFP